MTGVHLSKVIRKAFLTFRSQACQISGRKTECNKQREEQSAKAGRWGEGLGLCQGGEAGESEEGHQ